MTTQLGLADLGDVYRPTLTEQPLIEAELVELELKKQLVNNSLNSIHAGMAAIGSLMADQTEDSDVDLVDVGHLLQDLGRLALNLQRSGSSINAELVEHAVSEHQ